MRARPGPAQQEEQPLHADWKVFPGSLEAQGLLMDGLKSNEKPADPEDPGRGEASQTAAIRM